MLPAMSGGAEPRARRGPARIVAVCAVAAFAVGALVGEIQRGVSDDGMVLIPGFIVFLAVGTLLVVRVPENRLSWVMLTIALSGPLLLVAESLGGQAADAVTGIGLFALFIPAIGVFAPLWFPTGMPPSPRWRWVGWIAAAGVVGIFGGAALVAVVDKGDTDSIESCSSFGSCLSLIGVVSLLVAVVAAVVSLIVRWRRAKGVERLQLRWLLPSFLALAVGILAEFGGAEGSLVASIFLPLGAVLVPVTIGIAVLRYRLYEIDRIVSRTVSYTVVVGLLGVVYVVGVTWLTSLLPDQSQLAVAATTLAVATLFNPLRKRVQNWVDHRFNRARYDTQKVMDKFSGSLRDRVDPDGVVEGWLGTVSETMEPSTVAVWVREAGT